MLGCSLHNSGFDDQWIKLPETEKRKDTFIPGFYPLLMDHLPMEYASAVAKCLFQTAITDLHGQDLTTRRRVRMTFNKNRWWKTCILCSIESYNDPICYKNPVTSDHFYSRDDYYDALFDLLFDALESIDKRKPSYSPPLNNKTSKKRSEPSLNTALNKIKSLRDVYGKDTR